MDIFKSTELYNLWFEVYSENWIIDLDASFFEYQRILLQRNKEKYSDFLEWLKSIKLLTIIHWLDYKEERLLLLKYTYFAMRIIDDICDKDVLLELSDTQRWKLIENIEKGVYTDLPILNSLMTEIKRISILLWFWYDYLVWLNNIIASTKFDLERILNPDDNKRTRSELDENWDKMDIIGTLWNSALLLWSDLSSTIQKALPLWRAVRIWYTLKDLSSDFWKWIINVPIEDLEKYNISEEDILMVSNYKDLSEWEVPEWIKKWIRQEISRARYFLQLHRDEFNLKWILTWKTWLEWESRKSLLKNSSMIYAFKRGYINELEETLKKVTKIISWAEEMWIELEDLHKWFSISAALANFYVGIYMKHSFDLCANSKTEAISMSDSLCEKYLKKLQITDDEKQRYFEKSRNLTLMYLWFLDSKSHTKKQLDWCAVAAFLSCAYDVCTDWWRDDRFRGVFQEILYEQVSNDLSLLAMNLYDKDVQGKLANDGLERWAITMQFISWCTWISKFDFQRRFGISIEKMWEYLQMVDDIIDVEEDIAKWEHNFLDNKLTRIINLENFIVFFTTNYFHKNSLLQQGITYALKKARMILENLKK